MRVSSNIVEFRRKLRAISADMEIRGNRLATAAAARVFRKAVAAAAPVGKTTVLRRSIFIFKSRRTKKPNTTYAISARRGTRAKVNKKTGAKLDAYYWPWVEKGHLARGPGTALRGGNRRRSLERKRLRASGAAFVPGRWFFRRGFRSAQGAAAAAYVNKLRVEVAKAGIK